MICFTLSLNPLSTTAPPLTVENILTAVQGVAWRKLGKELIGGDYNLQSHQRDYPKLDEIEKQHQSDDSRLHAVIECWLQGEGKDNEPSWRKIIWTLDDANETRATANTIRHFAEPLPGKSRDSITYAVYKSCLIFWCSLNSNYIGYQNLPPVLHSWSGYGTSVSSSQLSWSTV